MILVSPSRTNRRPGKDHNRNAHGPAAANVNTMFYFGNSAAQDEHRARTTHNRRKSGAGYCEERNRFPNWLGTQNSFAGALVVYQESRQP